MAKKTSGSHSLVQTAGWTGMQAACNEEGRPGLSLHQGGKNQEASPGGAVPPDTSTVEEVQPYRKYEGHFSRGKSPSKIPEDAGHGGTCLNPRN